jgi:hypothetical protein
MSEQKRRTVGQEFLKLLDEAKKSKDKLLNLADALIKRSPSKRGLKVRNLPQDETAVQMNATTAKFNAYAGKDVSTDGMLMMVENAYRVGKFGNPKKFHKDFAEKYPDEYYLADKEREIGKSATPKGKQLDPRILQRCAGDITQATV